METATTTIYTYRHTLSLHDALPICPNGIPYHLKFGLLNSKVNPEPLFVAVAALDSRLRGNDGVGAWRVHPTLTKLSITRFLPACSKSISSLLPSISAVSP